MKRRIKKVLAVIATTVLVVGLFAYTMDKLNRFSLHAVYEGNNVFLTDDGNEWEYELEVPPVKGTEVELQCYLTDGKPYTETEITGISLY